MTIASSTTRVSFLTDGVSTVFPVPIQAYASTDFLVTLTPAGSDGVPLTLNSDYTLAPSGTLSPTAWSLTTSIVQPAGLTLQVVLNPKQAQNTQYVQGQAFPSAAVQANVDRLTQMVLRLQDQVARAIVAPDADPSPIMLLPQRTERANTFPTFDVNGNIALATSLPGGVLSRSSIGNLLYPRNQAEINAGVVPTDLGYPYLYARRYGVKFDGVTDDAPAWNSAIQVALNSAAPSGSIYQYGGTIIGDYGVTRCAGTVLLASNVRILGPSLPQGQGFGALAANSKVGCMVFFDDIASTTSYLFDTAPFVQTTAINGDAGTATAGAASTITLRVGAPNCTGGVISITAGTGVGQVRNIQSQAGTVATVAWPWVTVPDATSVYSVQGFAVGSRFTAEPSPFSNSTHFTPQTALPFLSSTENAGLEKFSMFSLRAHKYGIRILGGAHCVLRDLYASGFLNPFTDVGGQINTWDNVTTDVSNGSFQVGFAWLFECAQYTVRQCSAFGDGGVTVPSAANRSWVVDYVQGVGSDATPNYQTGHYCYENVGIHFDNSDGENANRGWLDVGPMGNTYTNCHMERFVNVGRYQNGGRAIWTGGMIDPPNGGGFAFDGTNCEFTLDSVANSIDFFGQTSGPQIGPFTSPFGGRVTVRNVKPVASDVVPSATGIVWWDAYPRDHAYYVSQQFGSDNNNGTGTSSSLASLAEAMARIPEGASGTILISRGETDFTIAATARVPAPLLQKNKRITISTINAGGFPIITFPTVAAAVLPITLSNSDIVLKGVQLSHDAGVAVGTMFDCEGRCGIYAIDSLLQVTAPSGSVKTIAKAAAIAAGYAPAEITLMIQGSSAGSARLAGGATTGHLGDVETGSCGTVVALKNANVTVDAGITGTWGGLTVLENGI